MRRARKQSWNLSRVLEKLYQEPDCLCSRPATSVEKLLAGPWGLALARPCRDLRALTAISRVCLLTKQRHGIGQPARGGPQISGPSARTRGCVAAMIDELAGPKGTRREEVGPVRREDVEINVGLAVAAFWWHRPWALGDPYWARMTGPIGRGSIWTWLGEDEAIQ